MNSAFFLGRRGERMILPHPMAGRKRKGHV